MVFSVVYPFVFATIIVSLTNKSSNLYRISNFKCMYYWWYFFFFRDRLYEKIFREIYIDIQSDLGKEILRLNNKTLEEKGTGIFIQRLVSDTESISTSLLI